MAFSGTDYITIISSTLPSGASTETKQDTGNTSLASIDSKLTSPITVGSAQGATTSGIIGPLVQAAATSTAPTYSTGTTNPLSLSLTGGLRTDPPNDLTTGNSIGLLNGTVTFAINGLTTTLFKVTGTFVGTIIIEGSNDLFVTAGQQLQFMIEPAAWTQSNQVISQTTLAGYYRVLNPAGYPRIRARMSAYTSGSVTIVWSGSVGQSASTVVNSDPFNFNSQIVGNVASGAADTIGYNNVNPVKIGGKYNAALPTFTDGNRGDVQIDINGRLITSTEQAQGSTTSGQRGGLVQGAVTTAAPSYTTAQTSPLSLTTAGSLRADMASVGGTALALGQTTMAASIPVTLASNQSALAVSNATSSNFNAEVEGQAASGAAKAGNPVQVGGVFNTTQPTVTNGQAVEAQSTARGAIIVATGTDAFAVNATQTTNPWIVAGAAASGASKSGNPVQTGAVFNTTQPTVTTGQAVESQATARGAQIVATGVDTFTATGPTITKGTQGSTGYTVQDLHDAGRTHINYYAVAAAAGTTTTETAITLTKSSGTAATSTGTSFVITSGKKYRITHLSVATRGNSTATIQTTTFNFRINTAGAVTTSSTPIVFAARSATPATASAWDRYIIPIPDGFEITGDGTLQFGFTAAATYTTNAPTWDVSIIGYEY